MTILSIRVSLGRMIVDPENQHLLNLNGVYRIRCESCDRYYIGSASYHRGFKHRFGQHISKLENGTHSNRKLLNTWKKYGESAFVFEILELCSPDECVVKEQVYFDSYNITQDVLCCNLAPKAGSNRGFKHGEDARRRITAALKLRPVKPETKERISLANRGRKRSFEFNFTPEIRAKISAAKKGKAFSQEHRQKLSAAKLGKLPSNLETLIQGTIARCKQFTAISPEGVVYEVANLAEFCRQHDLSYKCMGNVARGLRGIVQHRGWKCSYTDPEEAERLRCPQPASHRYKNYILTSPDGEFFQVENLRQFCKVLGLKPEPFYQVANGHAKTCNGGWTCQRISDKDK